MRAAVAEITRSSPPADVAAAATAFEAKLLGAGGAAGGGRGRGVPGGGGGAPGGGAPAAPPPPNFSGLVGAFNRQLETLDYADMAPNEPITRAYAAACSDLRTAVTNWKNINAKDLAEFNAVAAKNNVKPIPAASPALAVPACPAAARGGGN